MFQFRAFPTYAYLIQRTLPEYCSGGFPHSEISGSMDICSSPKLIAACHVLLRLLMPRHSPCALYSLTYLRYFGSQYSFELCRQSQDFSFHRNCNCYPHLFRCSTIKIHNFQALAWLKPSVALLSHHFSSLFSFQGTSRRCGLRITRHIPSDLPRSLRHISSPTRKRLRWFARGAPAISDSQISKLKSP